MRTADRAAPWEMPDVKDRDLSAKNPLRPATAPEAGAVLPRAAAPDDAGSDEAAEKRRSLRPLLALKPYLMRHPVRLVGALAALVVAAMAMLTIPMAIRRRAKDPWAAHPPPTPAPA